MDKIEKFVTKVVGYEHKSAIKSSFNDTRTDKATRFGFKVRWHVFDNERLELSKNA